MEKSKADFAETSYLLYLGWVVTKQPSLGFYCIFRRSTNKPALTNEKPGFLLLANHSPASMDTNPIHCAMCNVELKRIIE